MEKKQIEGKRLGKQAHRVDERTLMMAGLMAPAEYSVPNVWDLDAHRTSMPLGLWGNDKWGDCTIVARGNHLVRLERLDTRSTVPLVESMVVDTYKRLTGAQSPGDNNDTGLVMLDVMKDWRGGWALPVYKNGRNYSIEAYGELSKDHAVLRAAAFLLGGIELGIALPLSAADQIDAGQEWDVVTGPHSQPGSWGGHAVYVKHFDQGGMWCVTWGREQYMTNRFIDTYADERWAVVDKIDNHGHWLDAQKLKDYLAGLHPTQTG